MLPVAITGVCLRTRNPQQNIECKGWSLSVYLLSLSNINLYNVALSMHHARTNLKLHWNSHSANTPVGSATDSID